MSERTTSVDLGRTGDLVTALVLHVFRLNGRLLAAGDRLVEGAGLTSASWQVVGAIALADAPQPAAHLARQMGLTRQAVQRTLNELAARGLVTFAENPHHRRAQLALLTRKGQAAYEAARRKQMPWANQLAAGLREKDLASAVTLLRTLTERLESDERPSSGTRTRVVRDGSTQARARTASPSRRTHADVR